MSIYLKYRQLLFVNFLKYAKDSGDLGHVQSEKEPSCLNWEKTDRQDICALLIYLFKKLLNQICNSISDPLRKVSQLLLDWFHKLNTI